MKESCVVLIAIEEFDNLGVGYLASVLSENKIKVNIIDFREGKEDILKHVKRIKPYVVGFSVIFQFYILRFRELILYLRESGITCHFSAGGQFASMRYAELFEIIPYLDSIVRFEGEYTFLELVTRIGKGNEWHDIKGIAYKKNGKIIATPLRSIESDLDKLPYARRFPLKEYAIGKKFATLLAGRGCLNNCSFCNNTEYVRESGIHFRRNRSAENVANEMHYLYHKKNCTVFLFEDDDFPLERRPDKISWIEDFCRELVHKKLVNKVIWKINCRPDEVDLKRFNMMKEHGLYHVFLGLDDGTDPGLNRLNKHMTVSESLHGISVLKYLDIGIDYGFMLFQPSSTFNSIFDNLDFLQQLCGDGYTPVIFLKMMPFFNTEVEKNLKKEGRLKGEIDRRDYDFFDVSLNHYFNFLMECFGRWLYHPEGFTNLSRWGRNLKSIYSRFYTMTASSSSLFRKVSHITSESNQYLLDTVKYLAYTFESGRYKQNENFNLKTYSDEIKEKHDLFVNQITDPLRKINFMAEYQNLHNLIL